MTSLLPTTIRYIEDDRKLQVEFVKLLDELSQPETFPSLISSLVGTIMMSSLSFSSLPLEHDKLHLVVVWLSVCTCVLTLCRYLPDGVDGDSAGLVPNSKLNPKQIHKLGQRFINKYKLDFGMFIHVQLCGGVGAVAQL